MATLAALLTDVYSLTNRPDLVAESTQAVKAATLKAHQSDFFPRDIVANNFVFANPALAVQSFNVASLTRWRAWSVLQNYDQLVTPPGTANSYKFDILTPDNLFDDYNILKQNVAWQIGMTLNLRCAVALVTLYYGYYRNIDLTNTADMGWISDSNPAAIINEAVRRIFKTIGYDEQASTYEKLVAEDYAQLKRDNILVVGY